MKVIPKEQKSIEGRRALALRLELYRLKGG